MVVICEYKLFNVIVFEIRPYKYGMYSSLGNGINQFGNYVDDFLVDLAKNKVTL